MQKLILILLLLLNFESFAADLLSHPKMIYQQSGPWAPKTVIFSPPQEQILTGNDKATTTHKNAGIDTTPLDDTGTDQERVLTDLHRLPKNPHGYNPHLLNQDRIILHPR